MRYRGVVSVCSAGLLLRLLSDDLLAEVQHFSEFLRQKQTKAVNEDADVAEPVIMAV